MGILLLVIGIIALIAGIIYVSNDDNMQYLCFIIVLACLFIPFKKEFKGDLVKTNWYSKIAGNPPKEVIKSPSRVNDDYDNETRKKQLKYLADKIISQKTNRIYNDGIYSTSIYRDDNGRDYIIMRTEDNSTIKMLYLDNGQERRLDQGVAIILGL